MAKGDEVFTRFPRGAVVLAPPAVSGIHGVPIVRFALASLLVSLGWALSTGLAAYFVGEQAKDLLGTVGVKAAMVILAGAAIGLGYRHLWQRRRATHRR